MRDRAAVFGDEVGEEKPALPTGKALVTDGGAVGLQRDATKQENLQLQPPCRSFAWILPLFRARFLASARGVVDKMLQCDCGFEARAGSESGLADAVRRHAWEAHRMALSDEEALVLALRAELEAPAATQNNPISEEGT